MDLDIAEQLALESLPRFRLRRGVRHESVAWTVVTVAALATLGATCEWEDTATLTVGLEKPRRADSIDQDALLEADAL